MIIRPIQGEAFGQNRNEKIYPGKLGKSQFFKYRYFGKKMFLICNFAMNLRVLIIFEIYDFFLQIRQ